MITQDMTKFMTVAVVIGIVLAIAIFRIQLLPTEAAQPSGQMAETKEGTTPVPVPGGRAIPSPKNPPLSEQELQQGWHELDRRQTELDDRQAKLDQRHVELDKRQRGLDQRQAELDQREIGLDRRQAQLDEREAGLDERQAELDQREAELEERAAALQAWEERLITQDGLLDEERAGLRKKEASLAEWEEKLKGRQRLSMVAAVVGILTAVPSGLTLVTLMRREQQTPAREDEGTQAVQAHQARQATSSGRPETSAITYSDDGRDKERTVHYVCGEPDSRSLPPGTESPARSRGRLCRENNARIGTARPSP